MAIKTNWYLYLLIIFIGILFSACGNAIEDDSTSDSISIFDTVENIPTPQPISDQVIGDLGEQLDKYITEDNPLFSGSVLVAQEGQILLSKGYNYANWELKHPNSSQTRYRISSITKPFTAVLVMMLVEKDFIRLEDRLCAYLPNCPSSWTDVTIEHLLAHTSGVPEYTKLPGALEISRDPHNTAELIDQFRNEDLDFLPGERYAYSNSNYILLGALIEQVTSSRYENFLQTAILNPLGIEDSGLDHPDRILKDRAAGYQIQGRELVNAPFLDMSNAYATAGMVSTIQDLYRFDQALSSGLLLQPETQEAMYTPYFAADGSGGDYGLGWQINEFEGHRIVGHTGGINGFHAYLGRYLDDRATIILLSNIETEDIAKIVTGLERIIFQDN
jgi:CubicO group peptidase (beta-lactamase class C family)